MQEQNGNRLRTPTLDMNEVDVPAFDLGLELWEAFQSPLLNPPIKLAQPIAHELFHVREGRALNPAGSFGFVGPAGSYKSDSHVINDFLLDANLERFYDDVVGSCTLPCFNLALLVANAL